jgi:hypothetical protein
MKLNLQFLIRLLVCDFKQIGLYLMLKRLEDVEAGRHHWRRHKKADLKQKHRETERYSTQPTR